MMGREDMQWQARPPPLPRIALAWARCNSHIRPRQATFRDGTNAPYKRGAGGSNPPAPTDYRVRVRALTGQGR